MLDLIIISGASKGIGRNVVEKCSTICQNMIVIGSSDKINSITSANCNIIPLQLDLINYQKTYQEVKNTINLLSNINTLGVVLCAAQLGETGGIFSTNLDSWEETFKCNVLGNLSIIKACENIIKSNADCKIVLFSGGGAAGGEKILQNYNLSKCALVRATENLALETESCGYNCSSFIISPGIIQTDLLNEVIDAGVQIKNKTDISEPVNFVYNFLTNKYDSKKLNGRFIHIKDNLDTNLTENQFKLRRIE